MKTLPAAALSTVALSAGQAMGLFFDPTAPVYGCVDSNGTALYEHNAPQALVGVSTERDDYTLLLRPMVTTTEAPGITEMCVLHRWTTSAEDKEAGKGYYYPLGRSVPVVPAETFGEWGSTQDLLRVEAY